VSGVLSVSRTSADSVDGRVVRSGIIVWTIDFEERREAHQGMDLKCAIGSARGWLWVDFGFEEAIVKVLIVMEGGFQVDLLKVEGWGQRLWGYEIWGKCENRSNSSERDNSRRDLNRVLT